MLNLRNSNFYLVLDDQAAKLAVMSKKYKDDAKYLNLRGSLMKIGLIVFIVIMFLLYVRFWWWWRKNDELKY